MNYKYTGIGNMLFRQTGRKACPRGSCTLLCPPGFISPAVKVNHLPVYEGVFSFISPDPSFDFFNIQILSSNSLSFQI